MFGEVPVTTNPIRPQTSGLSPAILEGSYSLVAHIGAMLNSDLREVT